MAITDIRGYFANLPSAPLEEISLPLFQKAQVKVSVLRLDQLHPLWGGNKIFKLKYDLLQAQAEGKRILIAQGGNFSNLLLSVAGLGEALGLKTLGIVRGEEVRNPLLDHCRIMGMELCFIPRETFRTLRASHNWQGISQLPLPEEDFPLVKFFPEGAAGLLAAQGCMEIIGQNLLPADAYFVACGTGTTAAGIAASLSRGTTYAVAALKQTGWLETDIRNWISQLSPHNPSAQERLCVLNDYTFGGYAKTTPWLETFQQTMAKALTFSLQPVYSLKAFAALYLMVEAGRFSAGQHLMLIHTGGRQGAAANLLT